MCFVYNIIISIYFLLIHLFAIKSAKARLWIEGRKDIFKKIEQNVDKDKLYIWFHFASLGEFEQGRPVLEHFKSEYPKEPILITFFSPSGYEIRKNYELADHVFYLPLDTKANAEKLISLIKLKFAVFTKYEYWYHYFKALHQNQIPLYIISGIFRENQPFFKWYGSLHREMLRFVSHFFVQNTESADLLTLINLTNVSISGDTRFDRVAENASKPKKLLEIERFCEGSNIIVAGSTWLKDEEYISEIIQSFPNWKLIIAPHEINEEHIVKITSLFDEKYILYSEYANKLNSVNEAQILIIN
ncbi:MAG: 3-deoxy-D-manno-octulosonic acid transferase, partial [Daejeonella sp.]|nr:3-deoxy-D-manno-octulosonic acid transferase [Daejeonella sp.]